ncbi:MAG: hypothetical protein EGS10_01455 [Clostridium sp.]|nr:hypothetical protein [Clostridium sp.]
MIHRYIPLAASFFNIIYSLYRIFVGTSTKGVVLTGKFNSKWNVFFEKDEMGGGFGEVNQ